MKNQTQKMWFILNIPVFIGIFLFWITGNGWFFALGLFISIVMHIAESIIEKDLLIIDQQVEIERLRRSLEVGDYAKNAKITKNLLTLNSNTAQGAMLEIEITQIENLEDKKLPITRTFTISKN